MAGKQGSSPKLKRVGKNKRGTKPGDKVLNRQGGGKPPSQIVTNPKRIQGIKQALLSQVNLFSNDNDKLVAHAKQALNLDSPTLSLTDKEQAKLNQALVFAMRQVPDWVKLPADERPGLPELPTESKPKPVQQTLQVHSSSRTVRLSPYSTQIEQVLSAQSLSHAAAPTAPQPSIRRLPSQRDVNSLKRVAKATK